MNSKDLTWNFHKIMTDSSNNSQRLRELTRVLSSKLATHDLLPDTRADLTSEYEILSLLSILLDHEQIESSPETSEHHSLHSYFSHLVMSNKDFRLLIMLLTWTETIKRVESFHYSDRSLIPRVSETRTIASTDPDSIAKSLPDHKNLLRTVTNECFWLIRAGKLTKAQDSLRNLGANWMALTIGGLCPYFNSQFYLPAESFIASFAETIDSQLGPTDLNPFEYGNMNISLFMKTCWALSKNQDASVDERALFGCFCGNLDAVSELSNSNPYDFFWALTRTLLLFRFKEYLNGFDDNYKTIDDCDDQTFTMPSKIPYNYPVSLENILQTVQKRFYNEFLNPAVNLQFSLISIAVKGQKKEYLDKIIASKVPEKYLRAIVHGFICYKNIVSEVPVDTYLRFDSIIISYLYSISNEHAEIDTIVFYIRYLSFNNNTYLDFFKYIFNKYPEDYSHRKIIEQLMIYSKDHYQGILCQVALNSIEYPSAFFTLDSIISTMEKQNLIEGLPERLIRSIPSPISDQSLAIVIKSIQHLALACKIKLGQILLSKTYASVKSQFQDFELRYWGYFFISLENYFSYYKAKFADHNYLVQTSQTSAFFEALQKLDANPSLLMDRHKERCRQIAEQLQSSLEEVTGVNYKDFPLREDSQEIFQFREIWWSWTIFMLVEAYAELKKKDDIESVKVLVQDVWGRRMVEDQKNRILSKIAEKLRNLN